MDTDRLRLSSFVMFVRMTRRDTKADLGRGPKVTKLKV